MNNKLMPLLLLAAASFVFILWRNPMVAADQMSDMLGNAGGLVQEAVDRVAEFVGNLG